MSENRPTLARLDRTLDADGVAATEFWSELTRWSVIRRCKVAFLGGEVLLQLSQDRPSDGERSLEMALSVPQARNLSAVLSRIADKAEAAPSRAGPDRTGPG